MPEATDVIRREHATISAMIGVLEEMLARYVDGRPYSAQDMPGVVNFFMRFADALHHAKEERVLFPAILRHDPQSLLMLDEILEDHQRMRVVIADITAAIAAADPAAYFDAVNGYIRLARQHIRRENEVLLPLADAYLSPQEQQQLAGALVALHQQMLTAAEVESLTHYQCEVVDRYCAS
jgi:hemerythrin-like domain-containing protein